MIQDRIVKMEATLKDASNLPAETKTELLRLLGELKSEVAPLHESHPERVQNIAHYTDASVQEALSAPRKLEQSGEALEGLTASVAGLEASHPRLAQIVNRIAVALSNMGI